jgi:hypothetical protein
MRHHRLIAAIALGLSYGLAAAEGSAAMRKHTLVVTQPVTEAEDGLLLGNGDLSVSVYQTRDQIIWRFGKGDVWDRRLDTSVDPKPPHIDEIAHGIAVERWKCPPYGGAEPVALNGTDNPQRMKELCQGAPASYRRRPYPCPKPVGELALHLPPDLPGLSVRQELDIEAGILRLVCSSASGIELRLTCSVPPQVNVLIIRWELAKWDDATRIGNTKPPVWFSLYRWADPDLRTFAQQYFAASRHDTFLNMDHDKVTPLPRPVVRSGEGGPFIEQSFPPEPTFPQGFRYLLAPIASAGSPSPVDMGATGEARLQLMLPNDLTSGWVVVAVPSSSDAGGPDAELQRVRGALGAAPSAPAQWEESARQDAAEFWRQSAVAIDDPLLENLWYETYHARRCTTRVGKTPPGLFLPSTVRDFSHWHGDYHTNYNYQQPYWGDYAANHLQLGDAYFTGMQYFLQMGKIIATKYYGTRGVFIQLTGYPILAEDDVLGAVPMGRMAYMTGWAANPYWWRYLCTRDETWLRDVGYPVLRDCALFYLDFMEKGEDGLYHVFPSNQGEDGFTGDPKDYTDRAQVMRHLRYCLRAAIQASEVLGADPELREQWRDRLEHAAGDDGQPPVKREGLAKFFFEANPPEFGDGALPAAPGARTPGTPWPGAGCWVDLWYAGQYPMIAMPNLRSGNLDPLRVYEGMRRIIERWRHPNGLIWAMSVMDYGHAGAWTETLGICAPLQEMMLQSYGGVLRLFPTWPPQVAAEFTTFRAEGAFLVSARWADGAVAACELRSERGGTCRLFSPWPVGLRVETAQGAAVLAARSAEGIHSFETVAGETYRVRSL